MKTTNEEQKSFLLITTEGKEISVEYEIDPDIDDPILEEAIVALKSNSLWNPSYIGVDIKFNETTLTEIDMKKIIGINWF